MDVLISDNACTSTTQKVKDILHIYYINSETSDLHHQHQNYILNAVSGSSNMSQITYSPSWELPIIYGCYVLCRLCTFSTSLATVELVIFPLTTTDISPALCF